MSNRPSMAVGIESKGDLVLYINEEMVCPADGSRFLDSSKPSPPSLW